MAPAGDGEQLNALARRAAAGDEAAFGALARALMPDWYRIAVHLLDDHVSADEVAHDVAYKVYVGLRKWNGDASVRTWTHRIAINACHDMRRTARYVTRLVSLDRAVNVAVPTGAMSEDPLARDAITKAVAELPEELNSVVSLRYGADLGFAEIASVLGVPQGTVSTRLRRALALLAKTLAPTLGKD